jgi:hypothetical protein
MKCKCEIKLLYYISPVDNGKYVGDVMEIIKILKSVTVKRYLYLEAKFQANPGCLGRGRGRGWFPRSGGRNSLRSALRRKPTRLHYLEHRTLHYLEHNSSTTWNIDCFYTPTGQLHHLAHRQLYRWAHHEHRKLHYREKPDSSTTSNITAQLLEHR